MDQLLVEDVADDEADDERAEADEEPLAQLLEVLDERRLLAVVEATGQPRPHWLLRRRVRGLAALELARRVLRRGRELRVRFGAFVARDGVLELAHPAAERAADLRQALRAEEQKSEQEEKSDLERPDVWHAPSLLLADHISPKLGFGAAVGYDDLWLSWN